MNIGACRHHQKRYREAIYAYQKALAIKSDLGAAHRNLIGTLEPIGDRAGLLAEHKRWAGVHPQDPAVWSDYALTLLRSGRSNPDLLDPEAAVAAARKAVAFTKEQDPKMLQTLALALGADDQHEEAVKACEKALKLIQKPDAQLKADIERALKRFKRAARNQ